MSATEPPLDETSFSTTQTEFNKLVKEIEELSVIQIVSICIIAFQYLCSLPLILISVRRLRKVMSNEGLVPFIRRRHPHATFILILFIAIYLCVYYPISIFCWNLFNDTCSQTAQDMIIMGFEETILLALLQLIVYRFWMLFYDHKHALASIDINWLQYMPMMIGGSYDANLKLSSSDSSIRNKNNRDQNVIRSTSILDDPNDLSRENSLNAPTSSAPFPPNVTSSESDWAKDLFVQNNFFLKNENTFGSAKWLLRFNIVVCSLFLVGILILCALSEWDYNLWFYCWFFVYSLQFLIIFLIAFIGVSPIYDRFYVRNELFMIVKIIFICLLFDLIIANFRFFVEDILQIEVDNNEDNVIFFYNKQLLQCIPETISMLLIVYICTFHVVKLAIKAQENDQFIEAVLRSQNNKNKKIGTRLKLKKKRLQRKAKKAWKRVSSKIHDNNGSTNYKMYDMRSKSIGSNGGDDIDSSSGSDDGISGIGLDGIDGLESLDLQSGIAMIDLPKLLQNYDGFIAFARHLVTELAVGNLLFIIECGILMTYASPEVHMQPIIKSSRTRSNDNSTDDDVIGGNIGYTDDSDTDVELGADDVMSHKLNERKRMKRNDNNNEEKKSESRESRESKRRKDLNDKNDFDGIGTTYEDPSEYNLNNIGLSITIRDIYDEMGGDIRIILPVILAKRFKNYIGQNKNIYNSSNNNIGNPNNEQFSGNFVMRSSMKQIFNKYIDIENNKLSTDIADETKTKVSSLMVEWENDDSLTAETKLMEALDEAMSQCWTALEDCYVHFKLLPQYPIIAKRLVGQSHEAVIR